MKFVLLIAPGLYQYLTQCGIIKIIELKNVFIPLQNGNKITLAEFRSPSSVN